jgi:hypothetical protein
MQREVGSPVFIESVYSLHTQWEALSDVTWGWGEHCWHDWKEYPLFTSVEIRCSKCGKLKEDDFEAEDAHKG